MILIVRAHEWPRTVNISCLALIHIQANLCCAILPYFIFYFLLPCLAHIKSNSDDKSNVIIY